MLNLNFGKYGIGVHRNMPFSEYAAIPAVNKSSLMLIQHSPEDCLASLEGRYKKDSTGFALGAALDDLMTGGMTADEWSAAHPVAGGCQAPLKSGTRKGQACGCAAMNKYGDQWLCGKHAPEEAPTATAKLSADDLAAIVGMKKALLESDCSPIFENIKVAQLVVLWNDEETGLHCKARVDGVSVCQLAGYDAPCSIRWDLKTTRCDSVRAFERDANAMGYWLQDAHYSAGANAIARLQGKAPTPGNFVFPVACSQPNGPLGRHDAFLFTYDDQTRLHAESERSHLMRRLKACIDANNFPPKQIKGIQSGNAPEWNFTYQREQQ